MTFDSTIHIDRSIHFTAVFQNYDTENSISSCQRGRQRHIFCPKVQSRGGGVRKHLRLKKHLRLNSHIILEHAQIEQEENIWKAKTQHALNYFRSKTEGELMIQG